jgi:thiamine biosynthesis lipoprotein
MRRARPLLGTIVDLQARARDKNILKRALEAGFAAIARVQRLMSFHESTSDVSRMNREAFRRSVTVDQWTWRVLQAAQGFAHESDGTFDITVGRLLATLHYLPRQTSRCDSNSNNGHPEPRMLSERGTSQTTSRVFREVLRCAQDDSSAWRDIGLEKNCAVRFRHRLTIDLGGIAKGFAVDCAVEALKKAGVQAGLVNAGGDLRVFGLQKESVRIRSPLDHSRAAGIVTLQNRALATSATYFSRKKCGGRVRSALINGQTQQPFVDDISISVAADDCMTADALTKIVFALRERARPILANHRANAVILERDSAPKCFPS